MAVAANKRHGRWPADAITSPVAVQIARTPTQTLHLGLAYVLPGEHVQHVHLAWDRDLREGWRWTGLWAVPAVPRGRLAMVAGRCRRIWHRQKYEQEVRYGLAYGGNAFDWFGRFRPTNATFGLTCATFALAVFADEKIELVDTSSWPERPDIAAELTVLAKQHGPPDVAATMAAEAAAGAKRILPHEVFGACLLDRLPAGFADASGTGQAAVAGL